MRKKLEKLRRRQSLESECLKGCVCAREREGERERERERGREREKERGRERKYLSASITRCIYILLRVGERK